MNSSQRTGSTFSSSQYLSSPPTASQSALAKQQRQEVKQLSRNVESDFRKLKRIKNSGETVGKISSLISNVETKTRRLATLRRQGLDITAPSQTVSRQLKIHSALAAGVASRAPAMLATGAVGVVHGALCPVLHPVFGAFRGMSKGWGIGSKAPVIWPVTSVAGLAVGGVVGAVGGVVTGIIAIPSCLADEDAPARSTFATLDKFPRAKAYAGRKRQSSSEIADAALSKAEKIITLANSRAVDIHSFERDYASMPRAAFQRKYG